MNDNERLELLEMLDVATINGDAGAATRIKNLLGASTDAAGNQNASRGTFIDPLMQGLTFGWADELGSLGARLGGYVAGASESRRDEIAAAETGRQRKALEAFRKRNPWTSAGLELTGALASGGPLAKAAKTGLGLAGLGVGTGAVAGAGAADENKLAGAATGGALGGVLGAALPAASYLGRRGATALSSRVSPIIDRFRQEPQTRAGRLIGENLQSAGITPAALRSRMRQLGPDATIAEGAGEAGTQLGQMLIGRDPTGAARNMAARSFGSRIPGMSGRLRSKVAETTGVTDRLQPSLDAVRARQKSVSEGLYKQAYAHEIPLTDNLKSLLSRPPMRAAFKQAKDAAETVGEELPPWFKMNDLGEWEKVGELPDMRAWDRMKQGIDRLIAAETDDITGRVSPKGRDLLIMKRQLTDELDAKNPAYADARQAFAGDEAIQQAMRSGERFLTMKTRDVHSAVKNMNDSEREAFLTGAVESIREKIGRARSGEIGSFKFLEADNASEKLRALFPKGREGDRQLAQLNRMLRNERTLRETETKLVGGSQTQLRDAASNVLGSNLAIPTTAEALNAPIRTGMMSMLNRAGETLSRERQPTIDAMSQMLLTPGQVDTVLRELQRRGIPQELAHRYLNAFSRGSAALAPAGGLLGGSLAQ